jgi:hypothetical protein
MAAVQLPPSGDELRRKSRTNEATSRREDKEEGLIQMRRSRATSWLTPALVLLGILSLAVPVSAGPKSNRLASLVQNTNRGNQDRHDRRFKMDQELQSRAKRLFGTSRVIITVTPGQESNAQSEVRKLGGRLGRQLRLINGMAVELPNRVLRQLAERSEVLSIHYDRPTGSHLNRTAVTVGRRPRGQRAACLGLRGLRQRPDAPVRR